MAASKSPGSKPAKTFKLEFGCDDGRASALSSVIYNGILARGDARSFRQGRLVVSVEVFTPTAPKAAGRTGASKTAKKSAKKAAATRGR
ncbi:MAG: hypothetical protein ABI818_08365 [Acidobacteriota bacterium]